MSGILIPGQENKPEPGGGIELPSGYARATPSAADSGEAAPSDERQAAPPAQGGPSASDFAFPPVGAQVQCPSCSTPYTAPVFTIIDFGQNPELRSPLLGGQINVAQCPSCGVGGALSAPLMVHDPENEFLGVFVPMQGGMDDLRGQKVIGDMTQALMRKLPSDARKGYLLQPQQFMDWQRFVEVLWGFEGVTPEMLRHQQAQGALLQRLVSLMNDSSALKIALERDKTLVDEQFFAMLDRLILMSPPTADDDENPLFQLRDLLIDETDAGAVVKAREAKIRAMLEQLDDSTTRDDLLQIAIDAWLDDEGDGEQLVGALSMTAGPMMDYQFLMSLSERIGAADAETRPRLEALRDHLVQTQEQLRQRQAQAAQQGQALLQEVLQADDPRAKLQELASYIDQSFMRLLAANIQQAQQKNATAAAERFQQIYQYAMEVVQSAMPEELQFLNELIATEDPAAARAMLKERRELLTPQFVESINSLEAEMRDGGRAEIADRLKSLRGQIALML